MTDVFVFGSNRQGRHGAGAAKEAKEKYGAIYGQAEGRQGNSYAIVTKELRKNFPPVTLDEIGRSVLRFLGHARKKPDEVFQVTAIGTGLAGFKAEDVAPFFSGSPENVHLPKEFEEHCHRDFYTLCIYCGIDIGEVDWSKED